jgi:tRNA (guanine37-N1)-methyltransferase
MQFDILTLFPEAFSYLNESIIKRAKEKGLITINIHNLRDWSSDEKHKKIDDRPFGGGAGMLIQVEPVYRALKSLGVYPNKPENTRILLTSAKGKIWNQNMVREYSSNVKRLIVICGHYEGFDNRIVENLGVEEISIGKFVLSGGELASMVIVDSLARLTSGVLGSEESSVYETYSDNNLQLQEYPQYTRPEIFRTDEGEEWGVPKVLLSGNHKEIENWKKERETLSLE